MALRPAPKSFASLSAALRVRELGAPRLRAPYPGSSSPNTPHYPLPTMSAEPPSFCRTSALNVGVRQELGGSAIDRGVRRSPGRQMRGRGCVA